MFKADKFFDLSSFEFKDIFDNTDIVWEILPNIGSYINSLFRKKILVANYKNKKNVFVGKGSIVHESAEIIGPAIIGRNCLIGHSSLLRENCLFGENVHIGHGSEVKNSIFLDGSKAAHLNYIGDSIVGSGVNISAGAILANFRLDGSPVSVKYRKQIIKTELKKFGAVIGDGSSIGANSVINPGTILGKKSIVYPLTSVTGAHEDAEIIK